jgi:hypothetical protein
LAPIGPAVGQGEGAAVFLAHIARAGPSISSTAKITPRWDDADLAGLDLDDAELGAEARAVPPGHHQKLPVGVESTRPPSIRHEQECAAMPTVTFNQLSCLIFLILLNYNFIFSLNPPSLISFFLSS